MKRSSRFTPSDSLVSRDCGLIVAQIAENLPRPVRGLPVAEDIDVPSIEDWALALGAQRGFVDIAHTVELTGICAACSSKGQ